MLYSKSPILFISRQNGPHKAVLYVVTRSPLISTLNKLMKGREFRDHPCKNVIQFKTVSDPVNKRLVGIIYLLPVHPVHIAVIKIIPLHSPGINEHLLP